MKSSYTSEEVEAWRDRVHRKTTGRAIKTKAQAFRFIQDVGFCFVFEVERSDSPCLWRAAAAQPIPGISHDTHHDSYASFVREVKNILPSEEKLYYGKLLRCRPTVVSLEYFPYFYALSRRNGSSDEHRSEFAKGNLSVPAKAIMDALSDNSPQVTRSLKLAAGLHRKGDRKQFDHAVTELQKKMFIVKMAEHYDPLTFEWETVLRRFPKETRRSRRISEEQARQKILQKYFENQLVGTVSSIQHLFGWEKQVIFRTLGHLKGAGVITPDVLVDGRDGKYYALVR